MEREMTQIPYLSEQILTYLGNKRTLIGNIENVIINIKQELNKDRIDCVDLFSGSGIVARMLKLHSRKLYANDLEGYSYIINNCYLSNKSEFNDNIYNRYYKEIINGLNKPVISIITKNYAPKDENNITVDDRVFYTRENAMIIDTIRHKIDEVEDSYKKFFLAPLLYEASVHCNTSGVFKGFYKSKETKIGKFGGDGENALERIKGKITLKKPILSDVECEYFVFQKDSNKLVSDLPYTDVIYIDPPYNQHPYGSNYFMLNTIVENKLGENISKVAGIPSNWNKSAYNKKKEIYDTFDDLISKCNSKYVIISYNNEGFLNEKQMDEILGRYGEYKRIDIQYPTFRGCRNLKNRDKHVTEYIFVLKK